MVRRNCNDTPVARNRKRGATVRWGLGRCLSMSTPMTLVTPARVLGEKIGAVQLTTALRVVDGWTRRGEVRTREDWMDRPGSNNQKEGVSASLTKHRSVASDGDRGPVTQSRPSPHHGLDGNTQKKNQCWSSATVKA